MLKETSITNQLYNTLLTINALLNNIYIDN